MDIEEVRKIAKRYGLEVTKDNKNTGISIGDKKIELEELFEDWFDIDEDWK